MQALSARPTRPPLSARSARWPGGYATTPSTSTASHAGSRPGVCAPLTTGSGSSTSELGGVIEKTPAVIRQCRFTSTSLEGLVHLLTSKDLPSFLSPSFLSPSFLSPSFLSPSFLSLSFLSPSFLSHSFLSPPFSLPCCRYGR